MALTHNGRGAERLMTLNLIPYLVMNGNAKEAMDFYASVLDAQVLFSTSFGEMPASPDHPIPPEAKDFIGHATLQIGSSALMFSDTMPGQPVQSGNQLTICISTDDKEKSEKFYEGLKQGGQVHMPLQETHFSPAYAIVTDKFGVTFQVYTEGKM
jgi:PhnB protein